MDSMKTSILAQAWLEILIPTRTHPECGGVPPSDIVATLLGCTGPPPGGASWVRRMAASPPPTLVSLV